MANLHSTLSLLIAIIFFCIAFKASKALKSVTPHPYRKNFTLVGKPCPKTFHVPSNHNSSKLELHVNGKYDKIKHEYQTGTFIVFQCADGFFPANEDPMSLLAVCQPDGRWSYPSKS